MSSKAPQSMFTESGVGVGCSVFTFLIPILINEISPRLPRLELPKYWRECSLCGRSIFRWIKCFKVDVRPNRSKQGLKTLSGDLQWAFITRRLSGWALDLFIAFFRMLFVSHVIGVPFSSSITSPGSIVCKQKIY